MFLRSCPSTVFFAILVFEYTVVAFFIDHKSRDQDQYHRSVDASNKDVDLYELQSTSSKTENRCPLGTIWFKNKCRLVLPNDPKSTQSAEPQLGSNSTTPRTKILDGDMKHVTQICPQGAMWVKNKCQRGLFQDNLSSTRRAKTPSVSASTTSTTSGSLLSSTLTRSTAGNLSEVALRSIFSIVEPGSIRTNSCPPGQRLIRKKCRPIVS